jgi:hypothetical protein
LPTTIPTSSGWPRARRRASSAPTTLARRWLESYEAPYLDPRIDEPFSDFIAKKKDRCPTPSLEEEPEQAREQGGAAQVADFIQNEVWRPHYDRQGPKPK